jgi:hypothetical protein
MAYKTAAQREVSQAKTFRVLPWLLSIKPILFDGPVDVVEDVQTVLRVIRDLLKDKSASEFCRFEFAGRFHLEAILVSARVVW